MRTIENGVPSRAYLLETRRSRPKSSLNNANRNFLAVRHEYRRRNSILGVVCQAGCISNTGSHRVNWLLKPDPNSPKILKRVAEMTHKYARSACIIRSYF